MSLLYQIQGLDRARFNPIVACISNERSVIELYRTQGIDTVYWPGIVTTPHTTGGWLRLYSLPDLVQLLRLAQGFTAAVEATEQLLHELHPDVVHLNSLVLVPCAIAAKRTRIPLVWHVRESVHHGHLGFRKYLLSRLVSSIPDQAIFISDFDRQRMTGGSKGVVVHNFVDLKQFSPKVNGSQVRNELGISSSDKVVLFLGGISPLKGIYTLLEALPIIKRHVPQLHCILAAADFPASQAFTARLARKILPLIKSGTTRQKVQAKIDHHQLHGWVHQLPFRTDVERLFAASDVVVFPSMEPHFARPVIEAYAMCKPVVASRLGGVQELVDDGMSGILVKPGDVDEFADAVVSLLLDADLATQMGQVGHEKATLMFDAKTQCSEIMKVYDTLLCTSIETMSFLQ